MGSVQGHASSKSTSPHHGGIILGEECLESRAGQAGQGPAPHGVTVVQSKYGQATVCPQCVHSSARSNKKCPVEYVCMCGLVGLLCNALFGNTRTQVISK